MRYNNRLTSYQTIGVLLLFIGADFMINEGRISHSVASSVISSKMESDEIE